MIEESNRSAPLSVQHRHSACAIRSNEEEDDVDPQEDGALSVLWWTNSVSLPIIASIGLFCNGLNLLVLATSEARRMPSWHLLVSLALFDSLFLLFAVLELTPTSLLPTLSPQSVHLISAHTRAVLVIRMFASTFYKASILIVVAFNVERYLCVCRPLWAHRARILVGGGKALGVVGGALGLAMACSVQWQERRGSAEMSGHSFTVVVTMRQSQTLQVYYRLMDWLSLLLFNLAPILLLSVLNFQLVFTLRRIVRRDSSSSTAMSATTTTAAGDEGGVEVANGLFEGSHAQAPQQQQQQRLNANAMLFAVVLLLFVCIGPQVPARLLYEWHGHYYNVGAVLFTCISQQLVFLNASLNFCLYCLISRRYRTLLRDTVARVLRQCHPRPRRNCVAKFNQCRRRRLPQSHRQQQSTSSN
uniref:G-protein coupled receptors family 1 profile domain-containing protein n=1 Tax=Globodera rostochiensis TaxID=31243 RepID=A0A914HQF0_GLORO